MKVRMRMRVGKKKRKGNRKDYGSWVRVEG